MKTVKLSRQYQIGSAVFDSLTFREPKGAEYRRLHNPIDVQRGMMMRDADTIWSYADALVQTVPPGVLGELDLVDSMKVEREVGSFFTDAMVLIVESTNSSSGSVGAPSTSTD